MTTMTTPVTPYAGTSGWSGSDASRERAENEDRNGTTSFRQAVILQALAIEGSTGLTWKELSADTGWHHGQATAPLSTLHKRGLIARLKQKRGRCSVYVLPEHVNGRETAAQGRKGNGPSVAELVEENRALKKKIAAIEALVAPQWRSYSYTRNDFIDDVRRALL